MSYNDFTTKMKCSLAFCEEVYSVKDTRKASRLCEKHRPFEQDFKMINPNFSAFTRNQQILFHDRIKRRGMPGHGSRFNIKAAESEAR